MASHFHTRNLLDEDQISGPSIETGREKHSWSAPDEDDSSPAPLSPHSIGALLLAIVVGGLVAGVLEVVAIAWPALPGPDHSNTLLLSIGIHGGASLLLVPLAVIAVPLLNFFGRRTRRFRRLALRGGAVTVGLVSVAAAFGLGHMAYQKGIIVSAIDVRPLFIVALVSAFVLALYHLLRAGAVAVARPLMAPTALAIAGFCLLGVIADLEAAGPAFDALADEGVTSTRAVTVLRVVADRDGDGHPADFCAGSCDCDDSRPWVSPTAVEVPGNGLDDDCYEGDMPIPPPVAPKKPRPSVAVADSQLALDRPNVLFITIDTLRADHLGCYGYSRNTSPNIDKLAGEGTLFRQARAQGPMTRFSVPALLTGRYFSELERTGGAWPRVLPSNELLAEFMADAGYHTAAFHSIGYLMPLFGMDQGFDTYDVSVVKERDPVHWNPTSDLMTDKILAYFDDTVANLDEKPPWLMWAYYGDPHAGYQRHDGVPLFGPSMFDLYDHEIYFTDLHLGRLLDGLEERGLLDNTVVVLTSDHGEGLDPDADHGYSYHGQTLFDNVLKVPLIVKVPGATPRVVDTSVGNIDVMPTLMEAAGLQTPEDIHGVSLLPYVDGKNPAHPPVFSEKVTTNVLPQKSMVKWPYKLIWKLGVNKFELYDIASDPSELHDLSKDRPDALSVLKGEFQVWRATVLKEVPAKDSEGVVADRR